MKYVDELQEMSRDGGGDDQGDGTSFTYNRYADSVYSTDSRLHLPCGSAASIKRG